MTAEQKIIQAQFEYIKLLHELLDREPGRTIPVGRKTPAEYADASWVNSSACGEVVRG